MVQVFYCPPTQEVMAQVVKHADYPHTPGMLYDCPKCETTCYCKSDEDGPCVYHALMQESEDRATQADWAAWYSQDS